MRARGTGGWKIGRWLLCLLVVAAGFQGIPSQAQNDPPDRTLSLAQSIELALEHSKSAAELDRTLAQLGRQHDDLLDLSESMQSRLDSLDKFRELHATMLEQGLDKLEAAQYGYLQMMFGWEPPEWDAEFMFNAFIRNRDFPHKQVQVAIENTERSKKQLIAGIALQVRASFDQWNSLQDQAELQQAVYDDLLRREGELQRKLALGSASEWDVYSIGNERARQELTLNQLKRNMRIVELSLQTRLGLPVDERLQLQAYEMEELKTELADFRTYADRADLERTEVQNARNEYENKAREWDILSRYITEEEEMERIEAEKSWKEAEYELATVRSSVRAEVRQAYNEALRKRQAWISANEQLAIAADVVERVKRSVEEGMASSAELVSADLQRRQTELALRQGERDYAYAVYQLELTCSTGPGFGSAGGRGSGNGA